MDRLLSLNDVAMRYGVDSSTIREWIRKGVIGYVMVGPARVKRVPAPTESTSAQSQSAK